MAVVTSDADDYYGHYTGDVDEACSLCGDQLSYPFMVWQGAKKVFICSHCGSNIRRGFTADLVQIEEICKVRDRIKKNGDWKRAEAEI